MFVQERWGWWLKQILIPVVVVVGIFGNTLSFIVMKSSTLRYKSYSHYLCALAVFDTLTLIGREMMLIDELKLNMGLPGFFENFTNASCKIYNFCEHVCYLMSSWLIVVMAFERIVAVYFPFRTRTICKQSLAVVTIFTLLVVISYTQVFRVIMFGKSDGKCEAQLQYNFTYVMLHTYFYQICLIFTLPVCLVLICNTMVLYKIHQIRKATENENSTTTRLTRFTARRYKTTFMLLTISFIYVLCTLPMIAVTLAFLVVWEQRGIESAPFMYALKPYSDALEVVFCMNYSVNFFVYVLSGRAFRRELQEMFHGRRQSYSSSRTRDSQVR